MLISTLLLLRSKCTVTERIPSSTTSTGRGKRKKATKKDASRHKITDSTTYNFLPREGLQNHETTSVLQDIF